MTKPTQRRRRRPKLCYHLLSFEIEEPGSGPDPYSIRADCKDCCTFAGWVMLVWQDAKPPKQKAGEA